MHRTAIYLPMFMLASLGGAGCFVGTSETTDSNALAAFADFAATVPHDDNGVFIIDGDTPIADRHELFAVWQALQQGALSFENTDVNPAQKWGVTRRRNLTYCVSNAFGARKANIVEAMRKATDEGWEQRGNVDFRYLSAHDHNCSTRNNQVWFSVEPGDAGMPGVVAWAFFPSDPRSMRRVAVNPTEMFSPTQTWSPEKLLAHELGHVLGFGHEHFRREAGPCATGRPKTVTSYDPESLMHYDGCGGHPLPWFSRLDGEGMKKAYGAPGGASQIINEAYTARTVSGAITTSDFKIHQVAVTAGKRLDVALSIDLLEDPTAAELFVRFGNRPTATKFECSTLSDVRACLLDIPTGVTTAYIGVRSAVNANYKIEINSYLN